MSNIPLEELPGMLFRLPGERLAAVVLYPDGTGAFEYRLAIIESILDIGEGLPGGPKAGQ
jgi:hypothetical protein